MSHFAHVKIIGVAVNNKFFALLSWCIFMCACSPKPVQLAPRVESQPKSSNFKTVTKKPALTKTLSSAVLSKSQANARLAAGATLIDARSADAFAASHLRNAINVPYELLEPTLPALSSYKEREILIVGQDAQQVEAMRKAMLKAGFKTVLNAFSLTS